MSMTVAEPRELESGTITDENAEYFATLVYQKDQLNAGIKTLKMSEWKTFMNYNGNKVDNLASYVGLLKDDPDTEYNYGNNIYEPFTGTSLKQRIINIASQAGVDPESGSAAVTLKQRIVNLEGTVGDASNGLVKDVADNADHIRDLQTTTAGHTTDINALKTTVGDASGGLVKDVTDNSTNIQTLQQASDSHTTDINALKTTVGDSESGLVKDVAGNKAAVQTLSELESALDGKVSAIETNTVPQVTVNTADISDLKTTASDLEAQVEANTSDIEDLKLETGSAYTYKGNVTDANLLKITVDGEDILYQNIEDGWVFNVSPATGNTLVILGTTYNKGDNVVWVKNLTETHEGHFNSLGTPINVSLITALDERLTAVEGRFTQTALTPSSTWASTGMNGTFIISLTNRFKADKGCAFLVSLMDGGHIFHADMTGNFDNYFTIDANGLISLKTGAVALSETASLSVFKM